MKCEVITMILLSINCGSYKVKIAMMRYKNDYMILSPFSIGACLIHIYSISGVSLTPVPSQRTDLCRFCTLAKTGHMIFDMIVLGLDQNQK